MSRGNIIRVYKASLLIAVVLASAITAESAVLQSSSPGTPKWLTITYTAIAIAVAACGAVWAVFKFFFHAALVKDETIQALKNHGRFLCDKEEDIRTIRDRGQFLTRDELTANPWILTNSLKEKGIFLTREEVFSRQLCADLLDRLLFELASDPSLVAKLRNALEDRSQVSKIPESSLQDRDKMAAQVLQALKMLTDHASKGAGAGTDQTSKQTDAGTDQASKGAGAGG